jgi:hypothetical protein
MLSRIMFQTSIAPEEFTPTSNSRMLLFSGVNVTTPSVKLYVLGTSP